MSWLSTLAPLARDWFTALTAHAIEATLLALLVLALVRFGRRLSSPVRHGLLLVALLKFLLPPVVAPWALTAYLPALPLSGAPTQTGAAPDEAPGTSELAASRATPVEASSSGGSTTASVTQTTTARSGPPGIHTHATGARPHEGAGPAAAPLRATGSAPPTDPLAVLLLLQIAGSAWLLGRHLRQRRQLRRLAGRCVPIARPELLLATRSAARRQGLRRTPSLVASPDRLGPAAAGMLRRRIVLPSEVVDQLPVRRLAPILEHEIAHHRRLDLWIDMLVFLGSLVWWMNPVYWLLARELRRRREDCCDAAALDTVSPRTYCHCLLDIAAILGGQRPALPALAHGSLAHPLGRRIRQIMTDSDRNRPRLTAPATALLLAISLLVLPTGTSGDADAQEVPPAPTEPAAVVPAQPTAPAASAQETRSYDWISAHNGQRLAISDDEIEISDEGIDRLVERGLDRAFVESLDGARNRRVTLTEFRGWTRHGFDPGLADELEAWGQDEVDLGRLLMMVWNETDAAYLRGIRELGYGDLDFEDALRLARYEVEPDWIADWREGGYDRLGGDELVRLRRYEVLPSYAASYLAAGYELSVDDLVRLHRYEVDEEAAQRLAEAGLDDFSVDDLIRLKRYEVDDGYVREMTDDGAVDLSVDDLVRLKRYEVAPDFAASLRLTRSDLTVDDLVTLKRYEVSPSLTRELADLGYADLAVEDLVRLTRYEVDLAYVPALESLGHENLSIDELIQLQRYEVDIDTIRALADADYRGLRADQVVQLQRYEVSGAFIRALAEAGSRRFSVDEMVRLRRYEVTPEYIGALASIGFGELGVDDLVKLKRYEVSADFIARLQEAGFDDLTVDRIVRLKRAES